MGGESSPTVLLHASSLRRSSTNAFVLAKPRGGSMTSLRRYVTSLSVLAFLVAPVPAWSQNAKAEAAMKEARDAERAQKDDEALAAWLRAIEAAPDQWTPHYSAGVLMMRAGKYDDANKHLGHALERAPDNAKRAVLRGLGIAYAFQMKPLESEKHHKQMFDIAVAAGEFDGAAANANELARIFLESGDVDGARRWYELGHHTAYRQQNMTDSTKALWDFRWEHAQARMAARRN